MSNIESCGGDFFSLRYQAIAKAYRDARKIAKFGVRLPEASEYPLACLFSVEQIVDEDFLGKKGKIN